MTNRPTFDAFPSPTRAHFRGRLEAIGLGRWASLFTGGRVFEVRAAVGRRWPS